MIQEINLGSGPNTGNGDDARTAGGKINANFNYLQDSISNINEILMRTSYSVSGQDLTMNSGWIWRILGIQYTNPVDVTGFIPYTASGKERLDVFVLNQSNTFSRIAGVESDDNPVKPPIPINTIEAFLVFVTDGSVGNPVDLGDDFIKKVEKKELEINDTGAIDLLFSDDRAVLVFTGSVTDIYSVDIYPNSFYQNKKHTFKNHQATAINIHHLSGLGSNPFLFSFPNEEDFILQPNEVVEFYASSSIFEFVGRVYVDDIIEVANYAALPGTGKTGKIYITIDTNKQYRWSGSVYVLFAESIILTTKNTTSASLSTQDITGFLAYVNGVAAFVIAANEIVKYHITDTGQKIEIRVNNRSVGSGQTALTSSDVLEIESSFATETLKGIVSTGSQTFGGNKIVVGSSSTTGNALEIQNLAHDKLIEISNNKDVKFSNLIRLIFNRVGNTLGQEPRIRFTGGNTITGEIYAEQQYLYLSGLILNPLAGIYFGSSNINFGAQQGTAIAPLITAGNGYKGGIFLPQMGSNGSAFAVSTAIDLATVAVERFRITNLGNIGVGTDSPNASSKIDVNSTTQGFLPPRMTTTQKNAIASPAAGLMVFDTTLMKLCLFTSTWETITSI